MKRVRRGKLQIEEDVAANNMGSGNIAIPEPPLKWKDGDELLKRYKMSGSSVTFERRVRPFKSFIS